MDLILDHGPTCLPLECKSGMTIASDWTSSLAKFAGWAGEACEPPAVIYGGEEARAATKARIVPWRQIESVLG